MNPLDPENGDENGDENTENTENTKNAENTQNTQQSQHNFSHLAEKLKKQPENTKIPLNPTLTKSKFYTKLKNQLSFTIRPEFADPIAITANYCSILNQAFQIQGIKTNWVGFYFLKPVVFRNWNTKKSLQQLRKKYSSPQLIVGPFQGNAACTRIKIGQGVCGTSIKLIESIVVSDTHKFPGHIACDSASQSEIVIPIISKRCGKVFGVLDIDSPVKNTWDNIDALHLEEIISLMADSIVWDDSWGIQYQTLSKT